MRAEFFLVVSAEVDGGFDPDDPKTQYGVAMTAAMGVQEYSMWPKGQVDARVIDARLRKEVAGDA